jgi:hypothetical protein
MSQPREKVGRAFITDRGHLPGRSSSGEILEGKAVICSCNCRTLHPTRAAFSSHGTANIRRENDFKRDLVGGDDVASLGAALDADPRDGRDGFCPCRPQ